MHNNGVQDAIAFSNEIFKLQDIQRATVLPSGAQESVAVHTVHVAFLAGWLAKLVGESVEEAVVAAVMHDIPETITGEVDSRFLTPEQREEKAFADAIAVSSLSRVLRAKSLTGLRDGLVYENGIAYLADKMAPKIVNYLSQGARAARDKLVRDDYVRMHRQQEAELFDPVGRLASLLWRVGDKHATALRQIFREVCELSESVVPAERPIRNPVTDPLPGDEFEWVTIDGENVHCVMGEGGWRLNFSNGPWSLWVSAEDVDVDWDNWEWVVGGIDGVTVVRRADGGDA